MHWIGKQINFLAKQEAKLGRVVDYEDAKRYEANKVELVKTMHGAVEHAPIRISL